MMEAPDRAVDDRGVGQLVEGIVEVEDPRHVLSGGVGRVSRRRGRELVIGLCAWAGLLVVKLHEVGRLWT